MDQNFGNQNRIIGLEHNLSSTYPCYTFLHKHRGMYIWCPNLFPRLFLWNTNPPCNSHRLAPQCTAFTILRIESRIMGTDVWEFETNRKRAVPCSLQNRLRVLYTLAKTVSALRAIESRRLRSIADSVTVAIPSYRLISLTLLRFMCCGMPIVCCRWNASGRCKHCSCKKAGKECSNCLPRRRENCENSFPLASCPHASFHNNEQQPEWIWREIYTRNIHPWTHEIRTWWTSNVHPWDSRNPHALPVWNTTRSWNGYRGSTYLHSSPRARLSMRNGRW